MMQNFHTELAQYVKVHDNDNATRVILNELANALVKDRENFIEVLRNAGVVVPDSSNDVQLIDAFVNNAPNNKKLLLGASLLINHRNQVANFDGEEEMSDGGVKTAFKQMHTYFCGNEHSNAEGEDYSNAGWSAAIKSIADVGGAISTKAMDASAQKKRGVSDALAKQSEARKQMMQQVLAQKQKDVEEKNKHERKKKQMLIIGGVVVLGLVLVVGAVVLLKKNK